MFVISTVEASGMRDGGGDGMAIGPGDGISVPAEIHKNQEGCY